MIDKSLNMRVRSALNDNPEVPKFGDVNVTSFKGTVQLSGFVNTAAQKSRAVKSLRVLKMSRMLKTTLPSSSSQD